MSEVLTEIIKMDPNFDTNEFIPNILESICRGDLEILKDWCTETVSFLLFSVCVYFNHFLYRFNIPLGF